MDQKPPTIDVRVSTCGTVVIATSKPLPPGLEARLRLELLHGYAGRKLTRETLNDMNAAAQAWLGDEWRHRDTAPDTRRPPRIIQLAVVSRPTMVSVGPRPGPGRITGLDSPLTPEALATLRARAEEDAGESLPIWEFDAQTVLDLLDLLQATEEARQRCARYARSLEVRLDKERTSAAGTAHHHALETAHRAGQEVLEDCAKLVENAFPYAATPSERAILEFTLGLAVAIRAGDPALVERTAEQARQRAAELEQDAEDTAALPSPAPESLSHAIERHVVAQRDHARSRMEPSDG